MAIFIFILALVVLIVLHELGHFLVAKALGIRVDEFGIGFPPRLLKKRFGETVYSLNAIPLGGFVRIFGEEGEHAPRSFVRASRVAQISVLLAGVTANFVAAWLALSVGFMIGLPMPADADHLFGPVQDVHTNITTVAANSPAEKAGIKAGDVITSIQNGTGDMLTPEQVQADEVTNFVGAHQNESLIVTVTRAGEPKTFVAAPAAGIVEGKKVLGVGMSDEGTLVLPLHKALLQGGVETYYTTKAIFLGLGTFATNIVHNTGWDQVAGPVGIVREGGAAVTAGLARALQVIAIISVNLAIVNLLPIPGLDGGRIFLTLIEIVRRKSLSQKLTVWLTLAGFGALILLMLVVTYHDIVRLIG